MASSIRLFYVMSSGRNSGLDMKKSLFVRSSWNSKNFMRRKQFILALFYDIGKSLGISFISN